MRVSIPHRFEIGAMGVRRKYSLPNLNERGGLKVPVSWLASFARDEKSSLEPHQELRSVFADVHVVSDGNEHLAGAGQREG